MASFVCWDIVKEIIDRNGEPYPGDLGGPAVKVVEYFSPGGQKTWGVVYQTEVTMGIGHRYDIPSEYIRNPRVIWERQ